MKKLFTKERLKEVSAYIKDQIRRRAIFTGRFIRRTYKNFLRRLRNGANFTLKLLTILPAILAWILQVSLVSSSFYFLIVSVTNVADGDLIYGAGALILTGLSLAMVLYSERLDLTGDGSGTDKKKEP